MRYLVLSSHSLVLGRPSLSPHTASNYVDIVCVRLQDSCPHSRHHLVELPASIPVQSSVPGEPREALQSRTARCLTSATGSSFFPDGPAICFLWGCGPPGGSLRHPEEPWPLVLVLPLSPEQALSLVCPASSGGSGLRAVLCASASWAGLCVNTACVSLESLVLGTQPSFPWGVSCMDTICISQEGLVEPHVMQMHPSSQSVGSGPASAPRLPLTHCLACRPGCSGSPIPAAWAPLHRLLSLL